MSRVPRYDCRHAAPSPVPRTAPPPCALLLTAEYGFVENGTRHHWHAGAREGDAHKVAMLLARQAPVRELAHE